MLPLHATYGGVSFPEIPNCLCKLLTALALMVTSCEPRLGALDDERELYVKTEPYSVTRNYNSTNNEEQRTPIMI